MSAHRAPEDIRKHLDHPVVDRDDEWHQHRRQCPEHVSRRSGMDVLVAGEGVDERRIPREVREDPQLDL